MLDIIVNGRKIAIRRGTAIQVELNNNIFSTDGIEGDVAYSFDVPAAHNDLIFDSARFVYVQRRRKYDCTILLAGTPIGNGNLYVTKATKDTYSCEVAVNAFPDGWRDRKLRDNDYGDDIIISDSYAAHKANWLNFLQNTLADDSVVKFPLFLDEDYYSDNEDFGMWAGHANYPMGPILGYNRPSKFVNRLSFYVDGNDTPHVTAEPTDDLNNQERVEWRIFNDTVMISEDSGDGSITERKELNQFSFAPAIKLSFIFHHLLRSLGYQIKGNFTANNDFKALFHQSLRSMDGTFADYSADYKYSEIECDDDISSFARSTNPMQAWSYLVPLSLITPDDNCVELQSLSQHNVLFRPLYPGNYKFQIELEFNNTESPVIGRVSSGDYTGNYNYYCIRLTVMKHNGTRSDAVGRNSDNYTIRPLYVADGGTTSDDDILYDQIGYLANNYVGGNAGTAIQIDRDTTAGTARFKVQFYVDITSSDLSHDFEFHFSKSSVKNVEHFIDDNFYNVDAPSVSWGGGHVAYGKCKMHCYITYKPASNGIENIYTNRLHYASHVPDITNTEFISTLRNMFGLAVFTDSIAKKMEFSFIKDILVASSLDLTKEVLNEESAIERGSCKLLKYHIPPLSSGESSDGTMLDEVTYRWELPDAEDEVGDYRLVRSENKYMRSMKEEDAYKNWKFEWRENGGNNETLIVGGQDQAEGEESLSMNVRIPHIDRMMHWKFDTAMLYTYGSHTSQDDAAIYSRPLDFPIIAGACGSFLNEGDFDQPFILLRYRGWATIPYSQYISWQSNGRMSHVYFKNFSEGDRCYELMSPVCYDNSNGIGNRVPGNDLTATGEHSIGEVYVKPWLKLLSNYEKITYRFLLPPAKLLEVIQLLRPQDAAPSQQVRWIFVENIRVLPIRMTFEIVEGKDQILTEIECAKPVMD